MASILSRLHWVNSLLNEFGNCSYAIYLPKRVVKSTLDFKLISNPTSPSSPKKSSYSFNKKCVDVIWLTPKYTQYEHYKTKHNKTMCIFYAKYCGYLVTVLIANLLMY